MSKIKTKKIVKESKKKITGLISSTFINKAGKKIKVSDIISKDDCWFLNKANAWILTHKAIKTIANVAGISKNYDIEESKNISPTYQNELEHVVRVTIKCLAKNKKTNGCVHSEEDILTITGEANRINTPNRGRGYLRKMAEKRAFDIAVLEHLDLYSSVYSEEEAQSFENKEKREPDLLPGTKEFELIATEINLILNTKDKIELKKVKNELKKKVKEKIYSEKQLTFLRELYKKEVSKKAQSF